MTFFLSGGAPPRLDFTEAVSEAVRTAFTVAWSSIKLLEGGLSKMLGPRDGPPLADLSVICKLHPSAFLYDGSSLGLSFFVSCQAMGPPIEAMGFVR